MKQIITLLIILTFLLTVFTACSDTDSDNGEAGGAVPTNTESRNNDNNISSDLNAVFNENELLDSTEKIEFKKEKEVIQFGGYDWIILNEHDGKVLILSKEILTMKNYYQSEAKTTWAECDIREYLNSTFIEESFNIEEKTRIIETNIENKDNQRMETNGGIGTTDKIFLLSIEEVIKYLGDSGQLFSNDTPYYISDEYNDFRIAYNDEGEEYWWWLRSPGFWNFTATYIMDNGMISFSGESVNRIGGVRPAMWISH